MTLTRTRSLVIVILIWLVCRVVFFQGYWGFDDLFHANYALHPDHLPGNHWETRLFYNWLLVLGLRLFGYSEPVLALPGLFGSLLLTLITWAATRKFYGERAGLLGGVLASQLVIDITLSTNPTANSLANGFATLSTAMVLFGRRQIALLLIAGAISGIAAYTHPVFLFYSFMLAVVLAVISWPCIEWRKGLIFGIAAIVAYMGLEFTTFGLLTGNPLYGFQVINQTHLYNQDFSVPLHLASGSINPMWIVWPFWNLFFSKAFGFLLVISLALAFYFWRHIDVSLRLGALIIVFYWVWTSFGSQHPFKYLPLDHDTRYWYPLALPCCIIASTLIQRLRSPGVRWALSLLLICPGYVMLLSSGNWGQNIEISRELLTYARAHHDECFVTDPYTLDEMYMILGARAPENVGVYGDGLPALCPTTHLQRRSLGDPAAAVLYNPLQEWRINFRPIRMALQGVRRLDLTPVKYRLLAYLVPPEFRRRYSLFIRKPAAQLAASPASMPGQKWNS
jgi:hypothetical protein